jgi:putative membrane protein
VAVSGCQRGNNNVQAGRENSDQPNATLTTQDKDFMFQAVRDNVEERSMGRAAVQKATNADVRKYAQMLVDDHSKALTQVVDLMKKKNVSQPKGLPDAKHEAMDKLNQMSGPQFDSEYIRLMVDRHEKAVAKYKEAETTLQDEDLKKWAKDVEPVLEKHLQKAQELQGKLSGK